MDRKLIIDYNENVFYRSPASVRDPSNKTVPSNDVHAVLHLLNHCLSQQSGIER